MGKRQQTQLDKAAREQPLVVMRIQGKGYMYKKEQDLIVGVACILIQNQNIPINLTLHKACQVKVNSNQ